jgi:TonB family protein
MGKIWCGVVNLPLMMLACSLSAQQATLPNVHSQSQATTPTAPPLPPFIDGIPTCEADVQPAPGIHKVGSGVKPPRPRFTPEAEFSNESRKMIKKQHIKDFQALSLIRLTVSEEGSPRDICIARSAGFGLDRQAYIAVQKYRFDPATQDGQPVASRIAVEVNFRLH